MALPGAVTGTVPPGATQAITKERMYPFEVGIFAEDVAEVAENGWAVLSIRIGIAREDVEQFVNNAIEDITDQINEAVKLGKIKVIK